MIEKLKEELHTDKETLDKKKEKIDKTFKSEQISLPKEVIERLKNNPNE